MNESYYERAADTSRYFRVMHSVNNRTPAHFHNTTELIAVRSGAERVVINGVERVLGPGEIGVSNSFDIHYYEYVGASEVTVVMISDEYLSRFKEMFGGRPGNFPGKNERTAEIFELLDRLDAAQNGNPLIAARLYRRAARHAARRLSGRTRAATATAAGWWRFSATSTTTLPRN